VNGLGERFQVLAFEFWETTGKWLGVAYVMAALLTFLRDEFIRRKPGDCLRTSLTSCRRGPSGSGSRLASNSGRRHGGRCLREYKRLTSHFDCSSDVAFEDDPRFDSAQAFVAGNPNESWPRKLVFGCTNKSCCNLRFLPQSGSQTKRRKTPNRIPRYSKGTAFPWNASQSFPVPSGSSVGMWIALDPSHNAKTVESRIHTRQNETISTPREAVREVVHQNLQSFRKPGSGSA